MKRWISGTGAAPTRPARAPEVTRRRTSLYLIAAAILSAVIPLILFGAFWLRSEVQRETRQVEAQLGTRASSLTERLDGILRENFAALSAVSAVVEPEDDLATFKREAERLLSTVPQWAAVGLLRSDSAQPLASAGPAGAFEALTETVQRVETTRRATVVTRARSGSTVDVTLLSPVLRGDGVRAVLAALVRPEAVAQIGPFEGGSDAPTAFIADSNGNVVVGRGSPLKADNPLTASMREAAAQAAGLLSATGPDGTRISSAFSRSPLSDWTSFVSMSEEQIGRAARRAIEPTLAAGALSVLLACLLAGFIFYAAMDRSVRDERLAASLALGELDARLLATSQEALGEQRKAASEREVLLREIYHRVKNNLQIVQSLLRLGSRGLQDHQREPFEAAVRRIGAMARVHTLLYNSPDLASIDFKDYLKELLEDLATGYGAEERSIEHVLDAKSFRVPLDTAVPLAFIAVEILTNSFRHAFPNGRSGTITVKAARGDSVGTLRIEDDGVGVSMDPKAKRHLGLTIVGKLVQQIGGSIEEPQPGSSVYTITFPLENDNEPRDAHPALAGLTGSGEAGRCLEPGPADFHIPINGVLGAVRAVHPEVPKGLRSCRVSPRLDIRSCSASRRSSRRWIVS
jgi:two-component sensor histidine kinase